MLSKLKLLDLSTGKTSEMIVSTLMAEVKGVREQKWNLERPLVFLAVMLRQEPGVRKYAEIHTILASWLKQWNEGKYATLLRNVRSGESTVRPSPVIRRKTSGWRGSLM